MIDIPTGARHTARVLHCIPSMRNGGAERQLVMLAAEQVRAGLQVDVALLYRGPYTEALEATGAVLHWVGTGSNHDPRLAWQLVRLIREIRPDIVQSWLRQMDAFAGLAARLTRTAWVLSERSSEAYYHLSWKDRTVRPWMGRGADAIIANSRGGDAYWRTRVPSRVRRAVVPNGLALAEIQRAVVTPAAELGLLPSEKMVLHANRLSPEKNVETLIAALPEVSSRVPMVAFLCGDGTHEADARRLARQHARPDRIRFMGYRADVWSLMKRCDLFVSLSHLEGHPNAVIEAAACGAPLVLSDIPAHREIASDDTAVFVDATSVQDVVRGLLHCLTDPAAAARRAVAARKSVEHLSSARMADEYAAIYRDVLIQRGGQAS